MQVYNGKIEKIDEYRFRIPRGEFPDMRVDGIIYTEEKFVNHLREDRTPIQVANVATLPGIVKYSLAMPDVHWGYGFPIGGVAAFDIDGGGIISPGGVGYDINCGVRLMRTALFYDDIKEQQENILNGLFNNIPCGLGSKSQLRLSKQGFEEVLTKGSKWAVEHNLGIEDDIIHTEEYGCMKGADVKVISEHAYKRGRNQLGTLGSGNHFLEVQKVDKIYDDKLADFFQIKEDQITIMIHTGSRGFGHQVCTDALEFMRNAPDKYKIKIPDRQLACAPVNSQEGKRYIGAMKSAANYAWTNRQVIMHWIRDVFSKIFNKSFKELGMYLIYDVAHNIAKFERHIIDGKEMNLCIHRKGATRSFGPGNPVLPEIFKNTGQPVIVPGDMGTASYLMVGTKNAEMNTFGSTCHGAGRMMSRKAAIRRAQGRSIKSELRQKGIIVRYEGRDTLKEEMPEAYKDIDIIADIVHNAGLSKKVARLVPLIVVKG
jgi:tRNA-splicing ligase RtcB